MLVDMHDRDDKGCRCQVPQGAAGTEETWGVQKLFLIPEEDFLKKSHTCVALIGYHQNQRMEGQFWISEELSFLIEVQR